MISSLSFQRNPSGCSSLRHTELVEKIGKAVQQVRPILRTHGVGGQDVPDDGRLGYLVLHGCCAVQSITAAI